MFNSSKTIAKISGAPVFSNFTAIVYVVDKSNEMFKSGIFFVETDEGGE